MWRFTRDRRELEELVQDVFVEAYLSLKSFRAAAPFEHWLRRIATRTGYRFWKKKARESQRRKILLESDYLQSFEQEDRTPSEAAEALHKLFDLLPPKDRLVLTLFYFEDLNIIEIAERTGWTRTLVKVRTHRARKKLKTLLEKAGFRGDEDG
jgi:RNA polymerase sigma-70 factor (ECF subfamily)